MNLCLRGANFKVGNIKYRVSKARMYCAVDARFKQRKWGYFNY